MMIVIFAIQDIRTLSKIVTMTMRSLVCVIGMGIVGENQEQSMSAKTSMFATISGIGGGSFL